MTLYLLDTSVVSLFDPGRRERAWPVIEWLRRNDRALRLSAVSMLEIEIGLLKLRREKKPERAAQIEALRDDRLRSSGTASSPWMRQ